MPFNNTSYSLSGKYRFNSDEDNLNFKAVQTVVNKKPVNELQQILQQLRDKDIYLKTYKFPIELKLSNVTENAEEAEVAHTQNLDWTLSHIADEFGTPEAKNLIGQFIEGQDSFPLPY